MNVRDQLLAAAAQVYADGGYHGATTRRIASAAGVNEITLFRHFGSKEALLREALARPRVDRSEALPDDPSEPARELTEWGRAHLSAFQARAPLLRTCLGEFAEHPDLVIPEISCPARAARALAGYLERLKQRGLASAPFDALVAATMFMGVLFSDAVGRDIVPDVYSNDPDAALTQYVALFLRGIGVEPSGKRGSA